LMLVKLQAVDGHETAEDRVASWWM